MSVENASEYFDEGQAKAVVKNRDAQVIPFPRRRATPPPTLAELANRAAHAHTLFVDKGMPSSLHSAADHVLRESGLPTDQLWEIVRSQAYDLPLRSADGEPSVQGFLNKADRTEPNPHRRNWIAARDIVVWRASK